MSHCHIVRREYKHENPDYSIRFKKSAFCPTALGRAFLFPFTESLGVQRYLIPLVLPLATNPICSNTAAHYTGKTVHILNLTVLYYIKQKCFIKPRNYSPEIQTIWFIFVVQYINIHLSICFHVQVPALGQNLATFI